MITNVVMKSGKIKSRSPFSTETDGFYYLEAPGSPWPAAVGFLGLPGSKEVAQNNNNNDNDNVTNANNNN